MRLSRFWIPTALSMSILLLTACSGGEKFPVRTYSMGDRVTLGPLSYSVFETQWLTHIGEGLGQRLPQHRFFLVRVSILNSGAQEIMSPGISIVDDNGATYEELTNGEGVPQWIGFLRQIKPADAAQGNLVFDAPPRHYKLKITDDSGQRAALIDIPLSFTAEAPQLINPAEIRKQ